MVMRLLHDVEIVLTQKYPHALNKASIPKKSMQQKAEEANRAQLAETMENPALNKKVCH